MSFSLDLLASILSCAASAALSGLVTYLVSRRKCTLKRERAVEEGVRSLLRNTIIEYHDKYTARGYCPIYVKESARHSYESYHELGGNGVVTKLYEDLMALPESAREAQESVFPNAER